MLTKEINKTLAGLQQIGFTYRGLYGEGSEVVGNFFQISNQTTLGRTEEEIIDKLLQVLTTQIAREEEALSEYCFATLVILSKTCLASIRDTPLRAQPYVRRGNELSERRAPGRWSETDHWPGGIYPLNKLLIFSQAAYSSHAEGRPLSESEANLARARYVRQALAAEVGM